MQHASRMLKEITFLIEGSDSGNSVINFSYSFIRADRAGVREFQRDSYLRLSFTPCSEFFKVMSDFIDVFFPSSLATSIFRKVTSSYNVLFTVKGPSSSSRALRKMS